MLGATAPHSISIAQVETRLSVKAEISHFFFTTQENFDLRRIWHDQRAMRKRMRGNRGDDESTYRGHEHRPAGGQRICRRPGWRGNNHAIRPITRNEHLVDVEIVG